MTTFYFTNHRYAVLWSISQPFSSNITMTDSKRKRSELQDGEEHLYNKRSRLSHPLSSDDLPTSSQSRIDPTYGQRGAFPGLEDTDDDNGLFYGPATDGLEYIRMVRLVASLLASFEQPMLRLVFQRMSYNRKADRCISLQIRSEDSPEPPRRPRFTYCPTQEERSLCGLSSRLLFQRRVYCDSFPALQSNSNIHKRRTGRRSRPPRGLLRCALRAFHSAYQDTPIDAPSRFAKQH